MTEKVLYIEDPYKNVVLDWKDESIKGTYQVTVIEDNFIDISMNKKGKKKGGKC
jgi:hypothetical protein